jgi:quinol monooxygenase YgiN
MPPFDLRAIDRSIPNIHIASHQLSTMEAGMRSEQVYWVFTVSVHQMDKFKPLIPKLVAATEKEPGALQFEFNIGSDQKTVDIFERYMDSKAALLHQRESFEPFSKEFFAVAKLTRWVIYGTPSDEFKKANVDFQPIYMTAFDGFVR